MDDEARLKKNLCSRKYYQKHRVQLRLHSKAYYYSHKEQRKVYGRIYYQNHKEQCVKSHHDYYLKNKKLISIKCKKRSHTFEFKQKRGEYLLKHREHRCQLAKLYKFNLRLKALMIVGKGVIACSCCGYNNINLVEINHMNGNGKKEVGHKTYRFWRDIVDGVRKVDDLNLLCKVCNIAHYVRLKYGANYNIKYLGRGGKKIQEGTVGSVLKATL